jgi:HD-GYP domain-containing protein (c-di-GMP phosphodiesterase class II)
LVDNGTNRVKPVASAGKTEGYLDAIKISVLDVPEGQSPAGTAIRKGKTVVVNDIQTNKGMRLWQKEITKRGYVSAAAIPLRSKKAIGGAFMVYDKEVNVFGKDEIALLEEIASDISLGLDKLEVEKQFLAQQKTLEKNYTIMRSSLEGTVKAIATLAEHKDPYTVGHENRVVTLALALGEELGLDKDRLEGLKIAATLHDVGKMYVPAEILSKPGRLTPLEFSMIQVHPNYSHDVLSKIEFPWPVARIALEHHERYDGSGYPQGKKGDAVLLESRILAVADVVEAMASHRPYRPALPLSAALEEIAKNKGKLYDPDVADALKRLFDNGYELPKP